MGWAVWGVGCDPIVRRRRLVAILALELGEHGLQVVVADPFEDVGVGDGTSPTLAACRPGYSAARFGSSWSMSGLSNGSDSYFWSPPSATACSRRE